MTVTQELVAEFIASHILHLRGQDQYDRDTCKSGNSGLAGAWGPLPAAARFPPMPAHSPRSASSWPTSRSAVAPAHRAARRPSA
jgi:hypothetical protein